MLEIFAALSVGITILAMVIIGVEHPPAAGTTLDLMLGGWTGSSVTFIFAGTAPLVVVHQLMKKRMRDLL